VSNEAKAVYQSTCGLFCAGSPRRDCRSLAILIRPTTHLINFHALGDITQLKEYNNSNAIIHKKKDCPQKWVKRPMITRHCVMGFLFVRITPTRLCLNTFGVSCGQKIKLSLVSAMGQISCHSPPRPRPLPRPPRPRSPSPLRSLLPRPRKPEM
jgi:hypothetical protein